MDNRIPLKWDEPQGCPPYFASKTHALLLICRVAHASADLHARRMSGLNPKNLDKAFRAIRPRARFDDYDQTRRDHACMRPASPRRNVQKVNGRDREQARLLPPDLRSAAARARLCG